MQFRGRSDPSRREFFSAVFHGALCRYRKITLNINAERSLTDALRHIDRGLTRGSQQVDCDRSVDRGSLGSPNGIGARSGLAVA